MTIWISRTLDVYSQMIDLLIAIISIAIFFSLLLLFLCGYHALKRRNAVLKNPTNVIREYENSSQALKLKRSAGYKLCLHSQSYEEEAPTAINSIRVCSYDTERHHIKRTQTLFGLPINQSDLRSQNVQVQHASCWNWNRFYC